MCRRAFLRPAIHVSTCCVPGLRELYRPDAEVLRARFGDFILINTNFARYNHYFGRDKTMGILKTRGLVRGEKDKVFFRGWIDFLGEVFHSFEDMLPRLANAFPTRNIVAAPSPFREPRHLAQNRRRHSQCEGDLRRRLDPLAACVGIIDSQQLHDGR